MNVLRLKETMLMNRVEFLQKTMFFLVRPETYWVVCYLNICFIFVIIETLLIYMGDFMGDLQSNFFIRRKISFGFLLRK